MRRWPWCAAAALAAALCYFVPGTKSQADALVAPPEAADPVARPLTAALADASIERTTVAPAPRGAVPGTSAIVVEVRHRGSRALIAGAQVLVPSYSFRALSERDQERVRQRDNERDEESNAREFGTTLVSDAQGQALVPRVRGGMRIHARSGELYGEGFAREDAREPVLILVEPDATLMLQGVDSRGVARSGLFFHVTPDGERASDGWRGGSDPNDPSLLVLRHAQLWLSQLVKDTAVSVPVFAGAPLLGYGMGRFDPRAIPQQPIAIRLPPSGRIVVFVAGVDERDTVVVGVPSPEGTVKGQVLVAPVRHGRAEFPLVGLEHRLRAIAKLDGARVDPVTFDGPTRDGEEIVVTMR